MTNYTRKFMVSILKQIFNWSLPSASRKNVFSRLIGAIEIHLSLGGLSRRQLLQVTFISIVNLQKSKTENNKFGIRNRTQKKIVETRLCRYFVSRIYDPMKSYSTKYVLSLLHLLIRPPVEPIRHLPSVLLILQYIDQNPNLFKNDKVKNIKYSWFLFFLLVSCMATFGNYVE